MRLYLVRHAIAIDRNHPLVTEDAARELTDAGARKFEKCVQGLSKSGVMLDAVLTSPLVRAVQTAEILHDGICQGALRIIPGLAPGGHPDAIMRELAHMADVGDVALVGHSPDMGMLATWMLTGLRHESLRFKKGGVACIQLDDLKSPPHGELLWHLSPGQMRAMA
jgi:phosphohistidine phosphatase